MLDGHLADCPGFFCRLFGAAPWKSWSSAQQELSANPQQSVQRAQAAHDAMERAKGEWSKAQSRSQQLDQAISGKQRAVRKLDAAAAATRNRLGDRVIDGEFFDRKREVIHLTAPWLPDDVHRLRKELFAAALAIQKAFIDESANRLRHHPGLLMSALRAGGVQSSAHLELLPDLWSSLFMVVPAVSTTSAFTRAMFGDLPLESIGWLLIDESGQSIPRALFQQVSANLCPPRRLPPSI